MLDGTRSLQGGKVLVGQEAADAAQHAPLDTFYAVKRLLGLTYEQAQQELVSTQEASTSANGGPISSRRRVPYEIVRGDDGGVRLACPALGRALSPEEVGARRAAPLGHACMHACPHDHAPAMHT